MLIEEQMNNLSSFCTEPSMEGSFEVARVALDAMSGDESLAMSG
jgi:hypothetical protein